MPINLPQYSVQEREGLIGFTVCLVLHKGNLEIDFNILHVSRVNLYYFWFLSLHQCVLGTVYRRCDLCLHSNRPLLKKHCIHVRHVSPGKKTRSHGKIAYTFQLAAKTRRFCPAVCARIMLRFSCAVRGQGCTYFVFLNKNILTLIKVQRCAYYNVF